MVLDIHLSASIKLLRHHDSFTIVLYTAVVGVLGARDNNTRNWFTYSVIQGSNLFTTNITGLASQGGVSLLLVKSTGLQGRWLNITIQVTDMGTYLRFSLLVNCVNTQFLYFYHSVAGLTFTKPFMIDEVNIAPYAINFTNINTNNAYTYYPTGSHGLFVGALSGVSHACLFCFRHWYSRFPFFLALDINSNETFTYTIIYQSTPGAFLVSGSNLVIGLGGLTGNGIVVNLMVTDRRGLTYNTTWTFNEGFLRLCHGHIFSHSLCVRVFFPPFHQNAVLPIPYTSQGLYYTRPRRLQAKLWVILLVY